MDQANEQQGTEGTPPPTGISLGYACVSTTDQNLERLCHSVTLLAGLEREVPMPDCPWVSEAGPGLGVNRLRSPAKPGRGEPL